jgi:aspartate dehydrogenase
MTPAAPAQRPPLKLAIVGFGAIAQAMVRLISSDPRLRIDQVIVPASGVADTQALCARLAPEATVGAALDLRPGQMPDLVAECAGHSAIAAHVVPALQAGVPCVLASVGALHDDALREQVDAAARAGGTRAQLIAGAIGAIDALSAAALGGLERITYIGRKPPLSWSGTPAEQAFDLAALKSPTVIFRGSARQAAQQYPKNANVAATVSLATLGMDATQVELIADPGVQRNVHAVKASGAFGQLELMLENLPLPDNPKSSALTAYSLARAIRNRVDALTF